MSTISTSARIVGDVEIGSDVEIHAGATLVGPLTIGDGVRIHAGAVIGDSGEHRDSSKLGESAISIGGGSVLREHVVVQRGLKSGRGTSIGDECYIMHGCHVAHDCDVRSGVTMSPMVILGGHSTILGNATLGIGAMTHQWVCVGGYAMVGMGSVVLHDVRPGYKVVGNPAKWIGFNDLGLQRGGVSRDILDALEVEWERHRQGRGEVDVR